MQYSEYYGLWLPEGKEFFSKDHANRNMEAIDTLLKEFNNAKIGTDKISKNFTTGDWEQIAAAPLVKQLYEENQSLKSRISTLETGAFGRERYSNIYIGQAHTYTDLNGQYLMVFSQNGAWKTLCGLAFANIVAYDNGCVVHPICGGVFDNITITTSANTITIEGKTSMGANTTVRFYELK